MEALHFAGTARKEPRFTVRDHHYALSVTENETEIRIANGKLCAVLTREPFRASYFYDGKLLTFTADRPLAFVTAPWGEFMREQLNLDIGKKLYGLGERFTPFVKNGQSVDIWNEDGNLVRPCV